MNSSVITLVVVPMIGGDEMVFDIVNIEATVVYIFVYVGSVSGESIIVTMALIKTFEEFWCIWMAVCGAVVSVGFENVENVPVRGGRYVIGFKSGQENRKASVVAIQEIEALFCCEKGSEF